MTDYAYNLWFKQELPIVAMMENGDVIYEDLLKPLAEYIKDRTKSGNNQIVTLVCGRTGSGKSNTAIQLATMCDSKWQLREGYTYTGKDFAQYLKRRRAGEQLSKVILIDEGSVALNSMNSQRKEDNSLTVAFDTLRSWGLITLICIPNERHLNKRINENHLDFMIKHSVTPPIRGFSPKGFATIYVHTYRDWGESYWKPIGVTCVKRVPKAVWEEYQNVKLEHQYEFIDSLQVE